MAYICKRCGTEFKAKHHLKQHYKRQILCEAKVSTKGYKELMELDFPSVIKVFKCAYCDKTFNHQPNRSRHQSNCKENKDVNNNMVDAVKINDMLIEELKDIRQEIAELRREKSSSPSIINAQNIYINNIQLNNFGAETYDHITDEFVRHCLMNKVQGAKSLIERIHFSDEVPENRNVRLKSLKNSIVEVKKDEKWVANSCNEALETMISKGCNIMNKCYLNDEELMDKDLNELDHRIQAFLLQMMDKNNNNYFDLRKRILALIKEYSDV